MTVLYIVIRSVLGIGHDIYYKLFLNSYLFNFVMNLVLSYLFTELKIFEWFV